MAKKWEMPSNATLKKWIDEIRVGRNWRRCTQWEKEFIQGWSVNMKFTDFVPLRDKVEKLEEIYAQRT